MYKIRATSSAKKLAKKLAAGNGMEVEHILLVSRASADRQVQRSDVQRWFHKFTDWRDR